MAGPIQIIPQGLLGFLQVKNAGNNPDQLIESISPTFEMLQWYLVVNSEFVNATNINGVMNGITSFVGSSQLTVPDREWWYVHEYHASVSSLAAGDKVTLAAAMLINGALGTGAVAIGDASGTVASAQPQQPVAVARNFFLRPGTVPGAWIVNAEVAASRNLLLGARITRLPI